MNTKERICFSALLALMCTSCVHSLVTEVQTPEGGIPLNISSSIEQTSTKVTADGFEDQDALGLYAVNYQENNQTPGSLQAEGNQADHAKYVFSESDWKWNSLRPVYYKDINTNVDLYVYYPYAEPDNVETWNFEVQKDQSTKKTTSSLGGYEASDFLWGKVANVSPTESKIPVRMAHRMAGVQVILQQGEGFTEGEFESLTTHILVTGTTRKASINLSTGIATPIGGAQATGIVMAPQIGGGFRAIVVPQIVAAGTSLFSITIDGVDYKFKSEENITYETGKVSTFTIKVNRKTPSGDYELVLGNFQISPWVEDRNTHEAEARQYYVVNVETPGTLGRLIKADKKNPGKIRNLKVTGQITDTDFYFMRDSMAILEAINLKEVTVKNAVVDRYLGIKQDDAIPANAFSWKSSLIYFSFPENVTYIGERAFEYTNLTGALVIPDNVIKIDGFAFTGTRISSVTFGNCIEFIGIKAFFGCENLSGELLLPNSVKYIGENTFTKCNFSGRLSLPNHLEKLENGAFDSAGHFVGDLVMPDGLKVLYMNTFRGLKFNGNLVLNNVIQIGSECFSKCCFTGDLLLPEGLTTIEFASFWGCQFSNISFPSTLRIIEGWAFMDNTRLSELTIPEGVAIVDDLAFDGCTSLININLPSTLQVVGAQAFRNCYSVSSITCSAMVPPTVYEEAFAGISKDNFVLEVPEKSVVRYRTEPGWGEFKQIGAHYDFSIGTQQMRLMNDAAEKNLVLKCPAGYAWSIESKPDWVEVNPSSGIGKTEVVVSVSEMARTTNTFEINEGTYIKPVYKQYRGRAGEVVFKIDENGYSDVLVIEQYDCPFEDGEIIEYQKASKGKGIDLVIIGEGFDVKDINNGRYGKNTEIAYKHFFAVEPYATYRDYFNVYAVFTVSEESGIETASPSIKNRFTENGIIDYDACFSWVKKVIPGIDIRKSVIILLENSSKYYGWTAMYGDGSAISVVPISEEEYPYDFRGLVQHEAGGHAFGKLGDEYIYHNAYIESCSCICCKHSNELRAAQQRGWFQNLSLSNDVSLAPWGHFVYDPRYSNVVDFYEGGYFHTRGVYRSEVTSCMNNNIPYFSAISRQAIVERIKEYAGEEFSLEEFIAKDSFAVGTKAPSDDFDWTFGVDPMWNRGPEGGSIIYMGDHPNIK